MRGAGMGIIKETAWGDWWPREGRRREARGQMTGRLVACSGQRGEEGREANSYMLQRKWGGDEEPLVLDRKLSWCHCESRRRCRSMFLQLAWNTRPHVETTSQGLSLEPNMELFFKTQVNFRVVSGLRLDVCGIFQLRMWWRRGFTVRSL